MTRLGSHVWFTFLSLLGGRKTAQEKKKILGTEVPTNFSDQCSLDVAYFLCLFSGRRSKSSQELCSWELFFSYFRWFFSLWTLGPTRKATFESLLGHFHFFFLGFGPSGSRVTSQRYCSERGNLLQAPEPRKNQSSSKVTKKWLSGNFPKVAQKWPRKWLVDPKRDSKVTFSGQQVTFGVTFELLWGSSPKVTF